jgi:hypothetical protein
MLSRPVNSSKKLTMQHQKPSQENLGARSTAALNTCVTRLNDGSWGAWHVNTSETEEAIGLMTFNYKLPSPVEMKPIVRALCLDYFLERFRYEL